MKTDNNFTIGFIGLGLIGGSIAKGIKRVFPNYKIIGFDEDKETLKEALKDGIVDQISNGNENDFKDCNYVFLCAPVQYNIMYLQGLKNAISSNCIITDVGSVKGEIHKKVEELQMEECFIGGHPMVGSEKAGFSFSSDRLVENAYYFITPTKKVNEEKVKEFTSFIEELGALTILLDYNQHDAFTAAISHVPHIIAAELVHLVKNMDTDNGILKQLAAGGFKDITRIASSSPVVWEQISLSNKKNIKMLLLQAKDHLEEIIEALDEENNDYLNTYFKEAGEYRDSVPDSAVGLMEKSYEIFVDIPDEPGTLSTTTTLLALNNISIKNIGIIHNREFEEGVLKIMLYDDKSAKRAKEILRDKNYIVYERK
ncbi:prephenate dehydrogenase/arogenate dehydrogenase family protein [Anaerostipes sp.]|uniref:prephenate dehydrogenase/arogenate dehydrogenase family protein n=1 Tax=Anaerostipes sp. TaxID=1872530 RepID=UPI002587D6B7|nr:prephenate dehydrogenase/arogenate dehydrogenase family protein [Anaerostipes sp.]MCI5622666.1 prephenate dehydrogenase/arogenate dehydrogenase family protein [Anaerostipes sp.]